MTFEGKIRNYKCRQRWNIISVRPNIRKEEFTTRVQILEIWLRAEKLQRQNKHSWGFCLSTKYLDNDQISAKRMKRKSVNGYTPTVCHQTVLSGYKYSALQ